MKVSETGDENSGVYLSKHRNFAVQQGKRNFKENIS